MPLAACCLLLATCETRLLLLSAEARLPVGVAAGNLAGSPAHQYRDRQTTTTTTTTTRTDRVGVAVAVAVVAVAVGVAVGVEGTFDVVLLLSLFALLCFVLLFTWRVSSAPTLRCAVCFPD